MSERAIKAMTLRLPAAQATWLEAVARTDQVTVSHLVREAIEAYLVSRPSDPASRERIRRCLEEEIRVLRWLAED